MSAASERIRAEPGSHAVYFYEGHAELAECVAAHIADALGEDAAVLVIATEAHVHAIEQRLEACGVDVRADRRVIFLDAAQTLASLIVGGRIDRDAFRHVIRTVICEAGECGQTVRAYGEMVDLLWQAGRIADAIELEVLWNELIEELEFSLLCAYQSEAAAGPTYAGSVDEVCRLHTSVSGLAGSAPSVRREATREFEPGPDAPRAARRFLEATLEGWGQADTWLDDARLLLSELVTNAVVHARSSVSVSIRSHESRLWLAVHDAGGAPPILRHDAPDAVSGRGLQIVAALSRDWGVAPGQIGKTVWAEL